MKLFAIAAAAYWACLQFVYPGYFHPLYPHHDDFYFPPGLSFDGHSLLEKLQWPRPLGFLMMEVLGKAGLKGYLSVLVVIMIANAALTIALAGRIFGKPISWFVALAYCMLLFAHPDFYVNYLHDAFGTLSYFYLILAMHAWYSYRESSSSRYIAVCVTLMLLVALTKETYFVSALVFWLAQSFLCRGAQRRAGAILLGASLVFFAAGLAANAYSMKTFLHVNIDASSAYHVSLEPAAVTRAFCFYTQHLLHPAVLALILSGIAVLYQNREKMITAAALMIAGICALAPYAVLPNHLDSMYAWTGATLAFSPVLFLSRAFRRPDMWRTGAIYAAVAVLTLISIRTSAARYEEHSWLLAQEKINRNIIDSYPQLKGTETASKNILITGLAMPFQPFHTASYIRAEFGPGRQWTVVAPKGAALKSEAPVRFAPPDAVRPGDYDAAFGFDEEGRLVWRWTHAQLAQAGTREQTDRILLPALNPTFDALAREPGAWPALLRAGVVYSQWGELDLAADFLQRSAAQNHEQNPYPLYFLGQVREWQGMFDEARRLYAQAVTLDTGQPNPAFRQALERMRQK
jgi:tetratricopeptide (TPR) repeat protein